MSSAQAVSNRDPFGGLRGGTCPPPFTGATHNQTLKDTPDSAMSGGYKTGVGNQSNIVVSEDTTPKYFKKSARQTWVLQKNCIT